MTRAWRRPKIDRTWIRKHNLELIRLNLFLLVFWLLLSNLRVCNICNTCNLCKTLECNAMAKLNYERLNKKAKTLYFETLFVACFCELGCVCCFFAPFTFCPSQTNSFQTFHHLHPPHPTRQMRLDTHHFVVQDTIL